jgi:hypothetical protein
MAKAETRIVRKILLALGETFPGSYFRKIHGNPFQHIGIPDILGCVDGYFFGLEVKTDSGKTSLAQELEGDCIKTAGGFFGVVRSPEDAITFIQKALKSV